MYADGYNRIIDIMSRIEKFGLFAGIIGLIVDSAALFGFAIGAIELSPTLGFWANPFVVATITFSFLCFSLCVCMFFVIQLAKNRWRRNNVSPQVDRQGEYPALKVLGVFLWFPTSILWDIGMSRYFWTYFGPFDFSQSIAPLPFFIASIAALYFLFVPYYWQLHVSLYFSIIE